MSKSHAGILLLEEPATAQSYQTLVSHLINPHTSLGVTVLTYTFMYKASERTILNEISLIS